MKMLRLGVKPSRRVALPVSILLVLLAITGFAVHSLIHTASREQRGSPLRLVLYADNGGVLAECRAHREGQGFLLQPTRDRPAERNVCAGRQTSVTRDVTEYSNAGKVIAKCRVPFVGFAVVVAHRSASSAHPPRLCLGS